MDLPARSVLESANPACLHGGDNQPETGNRHGEWVDVHAPHAVERLLRRLDLVALDLAPLPKQPGEAAEQEVPRAARRVNHPHRVEAELVEGGGERPVEDEFL